MNFLNPIEILDLKEYAPVDMDPAIIRKKRKLLLAEIELADNNSIEIAGHTITKSEVETLAAALDNREHLAYYHFIYNTPRLQAFLSNGDDEFFNPFTTDPIYQDPVFIAFISPWFAHSYNQLLHKLFRNRMTTAFLAVIRTEPLILPQHRDEAYTNIVAIIRRFIDETNVTTEKATTGNIEINRVRPWIKNLEIEVINALPPYFQSLRNECAQAIRDLAVILFDRKQEFALGLELLDHAKSINTDATISQAISKEQEHLHFVFHTSKGSFSLLEEKIRGIQSLINDILFDRMSAVDALLWLVHNINPAMLNAMLPFVAKKRQELALKINELGDTIYNKYGVAGHVIPFVEIAAIIDCEDAHATNLIKQNLSRLRSRQDHRGPDTMYESAPGRQPREKNNDNTWRWILVAIPVLFGIIRIVISNSPVISNSSSSTQSLADYSVAQEKIRQKEQELMQVQAAIAAQEDAKWKKNRLPNGSSPLDDCFGKGDFNGTRSITIVNKDSTDVIVCLVAASSQSIIRNTYVKAHTTFQMPNVPTGSYHMQAYAGTGWNPDKENFCGNRGAFVKNVHYLSMRLFGEQIIVTTKAVNKKIIIDTERGANTSTVYVSDSFYPPQRPE